MITEVQRFQKLAGLKEATEPEDPGSEEISSEEPSSKEPEKDSSSDESNKKFAKTPTELAKQFQNIKQMISKGEATPDSKEANLMSMITDLIVNIANQTSGTNVLRKGYNVMKQSFDKKP